MMSFLFRITVCALFRWLRPSELCGIVFCVNREGFVLCNTKN